MAHEWHTVGSINGFRTTCSKCGTPYEQDDGKCKADAVRTADTSSTEIEAVK